MALSFCPGFQTIAEHVNRLRESFKLQIDDGQVAQLFIELVEQGLLISEQSFYGHVPRAETRGQRISTIGLVTANRAGLCTAALGSFAQNAVNFSRKVVFAVFDDSHSSDVRCSYRQELARLTGRFSQVVRYAGRDEKERYVANLANVGIDPDVARFALLGENDDALITVGANRNCMLLDTMGECIVSTDDDILCQTARHPRFRNQLRISGHTYPRDLWFFKDRNEVHANVRWESFDVLLEHERLLGMPVGELLLAERGSHGAELGDACQHILAEVLKGTASVVSTISGVVGDSGANSPNWMLSAAGQVRENLLRSKSIYDLAQTSREILGVAECPTIAHLDVYMAGHIGLDNRTLLAPFFPVARGEDGIFGTLMMHCFPQFFFGHLPSAVLHDATPGRLYQTEPEIRIHELMRYLIASCQLPAGISGANALRFTGRYLQEIARLQNHDFNSCVSQLLIAAYVRPMRRVQAIVDEISNCPDYWQRDVQNWHMKTALLLAGRYNFIPVEFGVHYPPDVAIAKTKILVEKTGKLLSVWPDITDAARELRLREHRISAPISP